MRQKFFFALFVVLTLASASCNKQNESSIDQEARQFVSENGEYSCDLLYDTINVYALFPEKYFNTDPEDYFEPLCARNESQYVLYKGTNELAQDIADYYNALVMFANLQSDSETAYRFGEDDESVYIQIADSIMRLDCSIIHNDTLRNCVQHARDNLAYHVRNKQQKGEEKVEEAYSQLFHFWDVRVKPMLNKAEEEYESYIERTGYFDNFESVLEKRGMSDTTYQQEILTNLYLAKTPAERHIYAIEFAHSDSTNASFLVGAAVLNREFVDNPQYSPYLSEMWKTWRASLCCLIGASSWAYIPNLIYNQKRAQIAATIIRYIENNPTDYLAQGVLIDLAGCENISRFGSMFGNAAMLERMYWFPEWEK